MFRLDDRIDIAIVACIALALLLASIRIWRHARRHRAALLLLQWPCALLLLAALLLGDVDTVDTLIVSTPGEHRVSDIQMPAEALRIALPGASADAAAQRVPDLATALRRHPAVRRIVVLGDGLAEHDLAAVGERELAFDAPAKSEPPSLAALEVPNDITAGTLWQVSGRIAGDGVTHVDLFDPSGTLAARATPDADGRFTLQALARAAGPAVYPLRLFADEREVQHVDIHVDARSPPPLRVLLLASAPSPELKYLRRWALDAGVDIASRIDVAPGLGTRRGESRLDAATLAGIDLLVLDERSWPQAEAQRTLLRDAIVDGLGVLVRVTGTVPPRVGDDLRSYGLDPTFAGEAPVEVSIDPRFLPPVVPADIDRPDAAASALPQSAPPTSGQSSPPVPTLRSPAQADAARAVSTLHAWPLTTAGRDIPALLHDADTRPLAPRVDYGRGRIALWPLNDTWRLATRGAPEAHASLWAHAWSSMARARAEPSPGVLPTQAVVDRRARLCGQGTMRVVAPDGQATPLLHDPATGCAAFWPAVGGWHRLEHAAASDAQHDDDIAPTEASAAHKADTVDGNDTAPTSAQRFYVNTPEAVASIDREQRRARTAARSLPRAERVAHARALGVDALRAGLLAAWLSCMAFGWWLERRAGRGRDVASNPTARPPLRRIE